MTDVRVFENLADVGPFLGEWDRLAEADGRPRYRPAWLLAWWRARRLEGFRCDGLRVIVVCDDHGLAGVAPLYVDDVDARFPELRFLGEADFCGGRPLTRSSGVYATLDAIVATIARIRPRPSVLFLDEIDVGSPWPDALARGWSSHGAWRRDAREVGGMAVRLGGTFDDWLMAQPRAWRQDYRRRMRRFAEHGGVINRADTQGELRHGLDELLRMHQVRWGPHGSFVSPVDERTLREASENLIARDGVRLWTAEIDDKVVGATAFASAGGVTRLLYTAFDPAWGRFAPGLNTTVAGIEEGTRRGDDLVDLRFGEFPYKIRLANEVRRVAWYEVFPRDLGYPLARGRALPRHARQTTVQLRVRVGARSRLKDLCARLEYPRARLAYARTRPRGATGKPRPR